MHEYQEDKIARMSVKLMEDAFFSSTDGKVYAAEYEQLCRDMQTVKTRYDELWEKAKPSFERFLKTA